MKKSIARLLALAMTFALLSGCAAKEEPAPAPAPAPSAPAASAPAASAPAEEPAGKYDSWPEKDITIIYNSKAGSGGDVFLRQIAMAVERLDLLNGHTIRVENIVDSTGAVAWGRVRDAEPDGYTLAMLSPKIVTADIVNNVDLKYTDLDYVAALGGDPQYIYCKADTPYDTLDELIEYVRANPGQVKIAVSSPTGQSLVCVLALEQEAGIEFAKVTYNSGSDQIVAVLGDFVELGTVEYGEIQPQLEAGEFKLIANLGTKRSAGAPDVGTLMEAGYDVAVDRPRGIAAPPNTDPELIDRMYEIFSQAYNDAEFVNFVETMNIDPICWNGEEYLASCEAMAQLFLDNLDLLTA